MTPHTFIGTHPFIVVFTIVLLLNHVIKHHSLAIITYTEKNSHSNEFVIVTLTPRSNLIFGVEVVNSVETRTFTATLTFKCNLCSR